MTPAGGHPLPDLMAQVADPVRRDTASAALHGIARNGVLLEAPGALLGETNRAMGFDGVDDHIELPAGFSSFPAGLTVEAWIYPTAVRSWARIIEFGNGRDTDNILFARNDTTNDLTFEVWNNGQGLQRVTAPDVLRLNVWQHVAATLTPTGEVVIYYDGQVVASGTTYAPRTITRTQNFIGRSNWPAPDEYFAGTIDEVAVYPQVLPPDRVWAHFQEGVPDIPCAISIDGAAVTVTVTTPGQNVRCTFSGAAGQLISATMTNSTIASARVSLRRPDFLTVLASTDMVAGGTGFLDVLSLPVASAAYVLYVSPIGDSTGSMTLRLYAVPATTTALTPTYPGSPISHTLGVPGQNAAFTIQGPALLVPGLLEEPATGRVVTIAVTNLTVASLRVGLRRPDGTADPRAPEQVVGTSGVVRYTDLELNPTGNYTLDLDPQAAATGQVSVSIVLEGIDRPGLCHWPHPLGSNIAVWYRWGDGLQAAGTLWRLAFEAAITDLNRDIAGAPTPIRYEYATDGVVVVDTFDENGGPRGRGQTFCGGSIAIAGMVEGNVWFDTPAAGERQNTDQKRQATAGHELLHGLGIWHTTTPDPALATSMFDPGWGNPTGYWTRQMLDEAVIKRVYP